MKTETEIRYLLKTHPEQGERALFDLYYHYVYTIMYHRLSGIASREDLEECVIDCFTEVFLHVNPDYDGSLKAYIGTVAKHKAINTYKQLQTSAGRRADLSEYGEEKLNQLSSGEDIEASVEQTEQTQILLDCIAELGEPDATILIQKFFYDHNASEISRIVKLHPVTIRVRCSRALKRLKKILLARNFTA